MINPRAQPKGLSMNPERYKNKNQQFKIVQTNFQNGLFFTKLAKKQSFV